MLQIVDLIEGYNLCNLKRFYIQKMVVKEGSYQCVQILIPFLCIVSCCNSIVLATTNADFLGTSYYKANVNGTYTTNGTVINNR